jgi:hypothetical protein
MQIDRLISSRNEQLANGGLFRSLKLSAFFVGGCCLLSRQEDYPATESAEMKQPESASISRVG